MAQSRAISVARGVLWNMADAQGVMPYSCDSAKHPCSRERRGNELFADFNVLATLVAAIEILKEVDG